MAISCDKKVTQAIAEWQSILGRENVLSDADSMLEYSRNTEGLKRDILGVLLPENTDQVVAIVHIAQQNQIPLYPISRGKNWGYGTASPVVDGCVIVDLKKMNHIIDFDPKLGIITLEPGVTQQQLYDYLSKNNYPFLTPTTGGGPQCSILGNALERGYGITPYGDHFSAVMSLVAVLPNGQIYRSPFSELGAPNLDKVFKWGIGPYLDGIFSQSSFGIITQMTLSLAPAPEIIESFWFNIEDKTQVYEVVDAIGQIMKTCSSSVASINLMNDRRVLAMKRGCLLAPDDFSNEEELSELLKKHEVAAWTGVGVIYGHRHLAKATKKIVKELLSPHCKHLIFKNLSQIQRYKRIVKYAPFLSKTVKNLNFLEKALEIFHGIPNEVALQIAYLKNTKAPKNTLDPARDGCGLLWYSPLVEMKGKSVLEYVQMVETICDHHEIDPLITLTALSDTTFDSTVPILFDLNSELENARNCYETLFAAGKKLGFLPYRLSSQYMNLIVKDTPYWNLVRSLKNTIDPDNLLSPGRYC